MRLAGRWASLGAMLAGVLVTVGLVSAPATAAPALNWGACPDVHAAYHSVCASVQVPQDYSKPSGPTISVMVSKRPASNPGARRGALFGNPGGPGGDGLGMWEMPLPDAMTAEWDLYAVQPRGLLDATPVKCTASTTDALGALVAMGATHRAACEKGTPGYTSSITTENTARDLESVRAALGLKTISLYGVSYGTMLMSTYATLFPTRVDRLVLDSGFDPATVWNRVLQAQTPLYKARTHAMMAWIAARDSRYHLGKTPLAVYRKWSARVTSEAGVPPSLAAPPAQVGDVPPGLKIVAQQYLAGVNLTAGARAWFENFLVSATTDRSQATSSLLGLTRMAAPSRNLWPTVAARTAGTLKPPGKVSPAVTKILTNLSQMQALILCNENQTPAQPWQLPEAIYANYISGDIFAAPGLAYSSGMGCAGADPVTRPVTLRNRGLRTTPLQIQSLGDPQTPYAGSFVMARAMRSHVVTVGGGDHGQLGRLNKPVDAAVVNYLRTGRTTVTRLPQAPIITKLDGSQGNSLLGLTR